MRYFVPVTVLLLLGALPVQAQETDTSATDTTAVDTVQVHDAPPDTTVADSLEGEPSDSVKTAVRDSVDADTLQAETDTTTTLSPQERAKKEARAAAESWLSLTDNGDFGASWDAADTTLQESISREAWIDQGLRARYRLDTLRSRQLMTAEFRDSTSQFLRGSPVVILQYRSAFERDSTREAVITTKRDTAWKVAGYRAVPATTDTTQVQPDSAAQ